MNPEEFIIEYEKALGVQDWEEVAPLISDDACVTFSNGRVHRGKDAVKVAFQKNFSAIKSEKYKMDNIVWLAKESDFAVYTFEFHWSGLIDDTLVSGNGIGTSVIISVNGAWNLLTEHLGKFG